MTDRELENKVAVVTGGSKGIGKATVQALCERGVKVVACSQSGDQFEHHYADLVFAKCDVRSYSEITDLMNFTANKYGGIDFLINNAGVCHVGQIDELTVDQWNEVIATNLTGVFYCSKAAISYLRESSAGHIVNLSSRAGCNGYAGGIAYNCSKFGLNGLSEALLLDLMPERIKVTTIMPGRAATGFGGEEIEKWQLSTADIASAVVAALSLGPTATMSRVEIRPNYSLKT